MARPRAVVLVTGSELVRGGVRDANGPFLAAELTRLGLEPARVVVVGDDPPELAGALAAGLEADLCVVSGGLGPTHDDRTVELLAAAAGKDLVVVAELEREIERVSRAIAARLGRPYADFEEGVRKQATLPRNGISLGLAGTAPAVLLEHGPGRVAIALPGPPGELRRLWPTALAHAAVRAILERAPARRHRVLRFFGPSESGVARALADAGGEGDGLDVTVCARALEIHVDLFSSPEAHGRSQQLADYLREAFSGHLFAEDDERSVAEIVLERCRTKGWTLATAESCTGGLVSGRLTDIAGSSDVFLGGLVAYADTVKEGLLGVPEEILRTNGAVSAETAAAMASGARRALRASAAVAVTGIAGPGGASPGKPVGLVHVAVEAPDGRSAESLQLPGDREAVRERATAIALHLLRRHLDTNRHTSA